MRLFSLCLLVVMFAVLAACGGSSDSSTTPTASSAVSTSTGAATSTSAGSSTATTSATTTSWTVSGQYTGTAQLSVSACAVVGSVREVALAGTLNGTYFFVAPSFSSTANGTLDYATSGMFVEVKYGDGAPGTNSAHWNNGSGADGSGTATVTSDGSGSMEVTVPASLNSPQGATSPITVSGEWTCP